MPAARKGPKESANDARLGETRKGLDGTMWVAVRVTPRDRKRAPYKQWRRVAAKKKPQVQTVADLRRMAKSRGIKGYARMKKAELLKAVGGGAQAEDDSAGYVFYYDDYHTIYEIPLILTKAEATALAKECEQYRAWTEKLWSGKAPVASYESRELKHKVASWCHIWDSGFYLADITQLAARAKRRPTVARKLTWAAVKDILTEPYGAKAHRNMGYKMLPMTKALYDKWEVFD